MPKETPEIETKPKTIYQKIAVIQSTIGAIERDKTNPAFRSKYFDVNSLAEKLIPLLAEQNILMTMPVQIEENGRNVIMLNLYDLDAEDQTHGFVAAQAYIPENLTIQHLGGAITYFRRYLPVSYFYLQAEDDDGNQASQGAVPQQTFSQQARAAGHASGAAFKRTERYQKHEGDDTPIINMDEEDII